MSHQSIDIFKPHSRIEAHERFNDIQKTSFLHDISFEQSLRARLTIIQGPPVTEKTEVILTLILRAMMCNETILVCAETNSAVRLCGDVSNVYLKDHNLWVHYGVVSPRPQSQLIWLVKAFHGGLFSDGAS